MSPTSAQARARTDPRSAEEYVTVEEEVSDAVSEDDEEDYMLRLRRSKQAPSRVDSDSEPEGLPAQHPQEAPAEEPPPVEPPRQRRWFLRPRPGNFSFQASRRRPDVNAFLDIISDHLEL